MEKEMTMPRLGESVTEGTIVDWLVKIGDKVDAYDPICEVQTAKVVAEVPASFAGTIKKILVHPDEVVPVGKPIVVIDTDKDTTKTESAPTEKAELGSITSESVIQATTEKETPIKTTSTANESKITPRFSPAVASLLAKYNLRPGDITGTGHQGRLTRKDVEQYVAIAQATAESKPTVTVPAPTSTNNMAANFQGSLVNDVVTPASPVRKIIAEHLSLSKQEIPHGWMMVETDVSDLVRLRQSEKTAFMKKEGVKLTFFPFFVKAVAQALVKHTWVNSTWDHGNIVTHRDINISIAVAKGDELFVPVIKQADSLSVKGIALEINRLAQAVRHGTIKPDEMSGGTFTVNNTGSFGSVASMGIINYPQAAILQVETIRKSLEVSSDGLGFRIADIVNLSLSVDHRLLDGVAAGGFLKDVKANLAAFKPGVSLY